MKNGYVALITVLIIGAVSTAIVVSLLLFGLAASRTSFTYEKSSENVALSQACANEVLKRIRDEPDYLQSGSITLDGDTCSYSIIDIGGQSREIRILSTVKGTTSRTKLIIDQVGTHPVIVTWQDVQGF